MFKKAIKSGLRGYILNKKENLAKEFNRLLDIRDLEIENWKENEENLNLREWTKKYSLVFDRLRDFHIEECKFRIFEKEYLIKEHTVIEDNDDEEFNKAMIKSLEIEIEKLKLELEASLKNEDLNIGLNIEELENERFLTFSHNID